MRCQELVISIAATLIASGAFAADLTPSGLRCEYRVDPLGIDVAKPRLSWIVESQARGQVQTAYRILVASSAAALGADKGDLWDTGKVSSDRTNQIVYDGKPLGSRAACWWKVRVWDRDGRESEWSAPARWTMGLLAPEDWKAAWIGYDAPADPKVAADEPLSLEGCPWIWYPEGNPRQRAPIGTRTFRTRFEIPADRAIARARIRITVDDQFELFVNGKKAGASDGQKDAWRRPPTLDVAKLLSPGANVLAVVATNTTESAAGLVAKLVIEFEAGDPIAVTTGGSWKAFGEAVEAAREPGFDDAAWPAAKEIAKVGDSPWGIPGQGDGGALRLPPPPYLRATFAVEKPVVRALAYATALGLYEITINGRRAGDAYFTPGWSDYRKRVYYQTIDVTDLIAKGENAIGAILADGWYAGYVGWGNTRERYGREPRLRIQLEIDLADGSVQTIATDARWKAAYAAIREADLLMGEVHDARLAVPGWDRPGFDDAAWKPVAVTESVAPLLQAFPGVPVKKMLEVPAKKVTRPGGGAYVFDLGQNMVGWVRLRARGEAGDKIVIRFAEMLNPDGTIYTTNLRGARATDTYILRGGEEEVWEPGFTFHGFQYVEVAGLRGEPTVDAVTGVVLYSATPAVGSFACSNPMVNQLYQNIVWGQRGNFLEIPTDCPQRDERLGWTGDAQVFIRTATYNMDVAAFFTKWLVDLEDGQQASGAYTHVAPDVGAGAGSPAWADAGIICPYTMYKVYGDTRVIERHYDAMARFIAFMEKTSKGLLRAADGYGDWLSIQANTPKDVIATAYFAYSTRLLSEMARVIGRTDDAEKYAKLAGDVRAAFCKAYLSDDGRVRGDTQTAYAFALYMDLLPAAAREPAFRHLVADLEKRKRHISTGFVGVRHLLPVLTRFGRSDIAYTLLTNETYPSWGYSIRHGATTIWERWDGWTEDRGFQDPGMNSFNHYAFGSVGEWMFATVAGIDLEDLGFARIRIRPQLGGGITEARATYRSVRGPIATSWKLDGDTFRLEVSIPANARATVFVPAKSADVVTEGGARAASAPGIRFIGEEPGAGIFEIGSGRYEFAARIR